MKAIKIKIEQAILDVPDNGTPYEEMDHLGISDWRKYRDGEIPRQTRDDIIEQTTKIYMRRTVKNEKGEKKLYLVLENDQNVFNDLLVISNDDFSRLFQKGKDAGTREFKIHILPKELDQVREEIRNLSWWKRLLKKF